MTSEPYKTNLLAISWHISEISVVEMFTYRYVLDKPFLEHSLRQVASLCFVTKQNHFQKRVLYFYKTGYFFAGSTIFFVHVCNKAFIRKY